HIARLSFGGRDMINKRFSSSLAVAMVLFSCVSPSLPLASAAKVSPPPNSTKEVATNNRGGKDARPLKQPLFSSTASRKISAQGVSTDGQTITMLPDGRQLLIGGVGADGPTASAMVRDPRTNEIVEIPGHLQIARAWHSATILPNGTVLIVG